MDYFKPFSADTQAAFFGAEAEMIRFGERAAQLPHAEYLKNTLLAIDAVFAIRMVHDVALPPVPLIVLFDVAGWKFDNDVERSLAMTRSMVRLPEEASNAAIEALHYMQALEWVSSIAKPGFEATLETVVRLNEILLFGVNSDERAHGFRKTYLPYKKGSVPLEIPREMRKLCEFCNGEYFSPLGQASVIHHAFERIVPFRLHDRSDRPAVRVHAHVQARPLRERAHGSYLLGRVFGTGIPKDPKGCESQGAHKREPQGLQGAVGFLQCAQHLDGRRHR